MTKHTLFIALFAFFFVLFCLFGVDLHKTLIADVTHIEIHHILMPLVALIIQILAVIFLAILRTSFYFLLVPLFITFLGGMIIFDSFFGALLAIGIPLSYMFWRIRKNITTRIKMNMSEDIRRPVTTFFVMTIFFGSFLLAPLYAPQLQAGFNKIVAEQIPQQTTSVSQDIEIEGVNISPASLTNQSMSDLIDAMIQQDLQRCQGDTGCEELMREEAKKQIREQVKNTPLESIFANVDLESDAPLSEEITKQVMQQTMGKLSFGSKKLASGMQEYFWGILAFLVFSPFAILFSFLTMIFVRLFYAIFRLTSVLRVTTKNVVQEIIV